MMTYTERLRDETVGTCRTENYTTCLSPPR